MIRDRRAYKLHVNFYVLRASHVASPKTRQIERLGNDFSSCCVWGRRCPVASPITTSNINSNSSHSKEIVTVEVVAIKVAMIIVLDAIISQTEGAN
jgi:hypothetical protein